MAAVLKLRRNSTDVSFLDASGFYVLEDGWVPKIGLPVRGRPPDPVEEVITLEVVGMSEDDLAGLMQGLDQYRMYADEYSRDLTINEPVYLHAQLLGETGERRAMARAIEARWLSQHYAGEMVDYKPRVRVGVLREGAWERTAETTAVDVAAVSGLGGLANYTVAPGADVVGDVAARLGKVWAWASAASMSCIWIGFRSANKHGTIGSFDPVLSFQEWTPGTDASEVGDATAKNGYRVQVDFSSETGWDSRTAAGFNVGDATDEGEAGPFLMIVRAKVDAGTVADIKFSNQLVGDEDELFTEPKRITATDWTLYPLVGLYDGRGGSSYSQMYARRVSGAGNLDLDCMIFIPVDEYFLFAEGTDAIGTGSGTSLRFTTYPTGQMTCYSADLAVDVKNAQAIGAGVPVGDGRLVVCAARTNRASTLADTLTIRTTTIPRWLSLRGSE